MRVWSDGRCKAGPPTLAVLFQHPTPLPVVAAHVVLRLTKHELESIRRSELLSIAARARFNQEE